MKALRRRHPRRPGLRALDAAIDELSEPALPRSELERRFGELCAQRGLPPPAMNATVAGFQVDAIWPEQRLVVELDGYAYHHTRAAFERDRARDAALALAGFRAVRVTARRLRREPAAVAETIRTLLRDARAA